MITAEQQANRDALEAFKTARNEQTDIYVQQCVDSVIGASAEIDTHLAISIQALTRLIRPALVPNLSDNDAEAILAGYSAAMDAIQAERAARDADIAAFIPPYPGAGYGD